MVSEVRNGTDPHVQWFCSEPAMFSGHRFRSLAIERCTLSVPPCAVPEHGSVLAVGMLSWLAASTFCLLAAEERERERKRLGGRERESPIVCIFNPPFALHGQWTISSKPRYRSQMVNHVEGVCVPAGHPSLWQERVLNEGHPFLSFSFIW